MSDQTIKRVREMVDSLYRSESRRVFASLIRLLGGFDRAEDALHDAFRTALEQWPRDGRRDFSTPHVEADPWPGGIFRT